MENNTEVIKKNSESKNLNIDKKKNISCKQDL